jgi:hypothetical protein
VEQLRAVIFLQALDVVAQGLLGDEQPVGGAGHMQVLGQLREVVQAHDIHRTGLHKIFL